MRQERNPLSRGRRRFVIFLSALFGVLATGIFRPFRAGGKKRGAREAMFYRRLDGKGKQEGYGG